MMASRALFTPQTLEAAQWYAILTKYRFERKAVAHLASKGVETFLPLLEEIRLWSDRRKTLRIPLFPGYAFVRLDLASPARLDVLRTEGVLRFVAFGKDVTAVPAKQVEDLRKLLSHKVPCSLHAFLTVGQRVRIRGGCLDGLEGILEQNQERNLVISITSIQRSVAIKIEGYELELI
ncbi:MAG TPA: UpxY family transcription antiterminator [Terriglobales bacterium]|jgi:transcription antitermination factor NusG|nr:UpxY family transcription antiterminator [Terriglobales bacterium]